MKKKNIIPLIVFIIMMLIITACSKVNETMSTKKETLTVYTTIFPLEDFTKKIGGKDVEVKSVYPPGTDAHTYEPTQKMMMEMANANLFIYNGAGLEAFAEKLHDTLQKENVKIIETTKGIDLLEYEDEHTHNDAHHDSNDNNHHEVDPHVWLDPILAIQQAETIKDALVSLKPERKDEFEANFEQVKKQLEKLDEQLKEVIQQAKTDKILVAHAAYGYWEKRYGLKQISVTGLSPSNEPSQKSLTNVIKKAKEHELKYILFETFATPQVAEVVKKEVGADILRIHHLSSQTEEDQKNNKDYFDLMNENIKTLEKALNE